MSPGDGGEPHFRHHVVAVLLVCYVDSRDTAYAAFDEVNTTCYYTTSIPCLLFLCRHVSS